MARRRGRGKPKAALKIKITTTEKPSSATSISAVSPKVHPATNDCYPLNKLCRLCLLSNTNMEPIFSYPGDTRLAQKIFQCTNLEIAENVDQGIPTSICGQCKKQLEQCHEFRLLCWKNNEVLHNLHAILSPMKGSDPESLRRVLQPTKQLLSNLQPKESNQRNIVSTPQPPTQTLNNTLSLKLQSPPNLRKASHPATPKTPQPAARSNPVVQLEKIDVPANKGTPTAVDLQQFYSPPRRGRKSDASKQNFGEVSLKQLYTPSRRGHKASKSLPKFAQELVVRLTPVSAALIEKYKKAKLTQTKAAVKSFPQPTKGRGRPPKPVTIPKIRVEVRPPKVPKGKVEKRVVKPAKVLAPPVKKVVPVKVVKVKPAKIVKPVKAAKVVKPAKPAKPVKPAKAVKTKRVEIAVPPKKRKENFESTPATAVTVSCSLCTQTFNNEKNLSRHMATHENSRKQNRVFNCDICKKEYLKASQLTDHLRSEEHISNTGGVAPEEDDVLIVPDEEEGPGESILPDNDEEQMITDDQPAVSTTPPLVESSLEEPQEEPEAEVITDEPPVESEADRSQPSPDTNETTQQTEPVEDEPQTEELDQPNVVEPASEEINANRDASPIPVESESSREGGVQYSDVCSTNNAENLFNGSGGESFNASRRVTFSDITEIVE